MVVGEVAGVAVVLVEIDGRFCDSGVGGDVSSGSLSRLLRLGKLLSPFAIG